MSDMIDDFFAELARGDYHPIVRRAAGTVRIELEQGQGTERWLLTMDRGVVNVSRRHGRADCVLQADRAAFERILAGELNTLTAVLRGVVRIAGDDPELLVLLNRLISARRHALAVAGGTDR